MFICANVYGQQQDVKFHLSSHLLNGQKTLKVKRDFHDVYLWVLAQNNKVYRINSLTLAVDDYSTFFAGYNGYNFIDIQGYSADTVFVATNSSNIIEYTSGNLRVIGSGNGIPGTVNSLGIDLGFNVNIAPKGKIMIATNNGMRTFDTKTQTIGVLPDGAFASNSPQAKTKIFETTYRSEAYEDSISSTLSGWANDTMKYMPIAYNAISLYNLNTVYGGALMVGYVWQSNTFGGNVNTVSALKNNPDIYSDNYFDSYFWGTEKGMSQNLWDYSSYIGFENSWKHYLDGIKVNKITNIMGLTSFSTNYNSKFIKQNLLVGTDKGLYFSSNVYSQSQTPAPPFSLFHDDELGNTVINDICVNAVPDATPICENGVWIAANDGLYLLKPDYGAFLSSQQQKVISFRNKPDTLTQLLACSPAQAVAIINSSYTNVQWYKDGSEIPGASQDTLAITQAGDYNAVIYDLCEGLHIESNHLKVTTISGPVFTFDYPDTTQYCDKTSATLNVTYNSLYHYRWYTNGILNGDTTSSFILNKSGKYKVEVSACQNSWIPSKEVTVNLIQLPVPAITTDKPAYCINDNAILKLAILPGLNFIINWFKDGTLLPAYLNMSIISTNIPGNYTATVTSTVPNTDGSVCSLSSVAQNILFNPLPTVNINQIVNTTLCQGQTIYLRAVYNTGAVKWSTGETSPQITVTQPGKYSVTVTTTAGCTVDTSIDVTFLSNPVVTVHDTSICVYKHQSITLTAAAGFQKYEWNNVTGKQTYDVTYPQTVTLTVTDINGCQATQQINVTEQCPDVYIPNAFTPNNDGINDLWDIQGLDNAATVKIFNRYGLMIYQSKGYGIAWNGTYNGKKLPAATYYYIVTAKNGAQTFSGSVTVIY